MVPRNSCVGHTRVSTWVSPEHIQYPSKHTLTKVSHDGIPGYRTYCGCVGHTRVSALVNPAYAQTPTKHTLAKAPHNGLPGYRT